MCIAIRCTFGSIRDLIFHHEYEFDNEDNFLVRTILDKSSQNRRIKFRGHPPVTTKTAEDLVVNINELKS